MNTNVNRIHGLVRVVVMVGGFVISGCSLPDPVVFQTATLEKCQKAIETEAPKFEKKVFGALKKCKDKYRAAVADGDPLTEPAADCDAALTKVLLFPDAENKSALAKAKIKLDGLTNPDKLKCSDTDLVALGHLPTSPFGDLWARLLLVRRIGAAIAGQIAAIRDTPDILTALAGAGCTRCGALAAPPCFEASCRIDVANSATEFVGAAFVPPSGNVNLSVCRDTALLGNDLALFAASGKSVIPFDLTGGSDGYICPMVIGGAGYIAGVATALDKIDTSTCQDHIDGDGDECPALMAPEVPICASPAADTDHLGVTNSGACIAFVDSAGGTGEAFILASARLAKTCDGGLTCGGVDQRGGDGIPCTPDDTGAVSSTFPIAMTTSSAQVAILDADNTDGNSLGLTSIPGGAAFDPDEALRGNLSGGTLVGGLPGLHTGTSGPSDSPVSITITCE
jgi:hypothetical protein